MAGFEASLKWTFEELGMLALASLHSHVVAWFSFSSSPYHFPSLSDFLIYCPPTSSPLSLSLLSFSVVADKDFLSGCLTCLVAQQQLAPFSVAHWENDRRCEDVKLTLSLVIEILLCVWSRYQIGIKVFFFKWAAIKVWFCIE